MSKVWKYASVCASKDYWLNRSVNDQYKPCEPERGVSKEANGSS